MARAEGLRKAGRWLAEGLIAGAPAYNKERDSGRGRIKSGLRLTAQALFPLGYSTYNEKPRPATQADRLFDTEVAGGIDVATDALVAIPGAVIGSFFGPGGTLVGVGLAIYLKHLFFQQVNS